MTIEEQLDRLADKLEPTEFQECEATIVPDSRKDLESFQADIHRLRRYASEGNLTISPHFHAWRPLPRNSLLLNHL